MQKGKKKGEGMKRAVKNAMGECIFGWGGTKSTQFFLWEG